MFSRYKPIPIRILSNKYIIDALKKLNNAPRTIYSDRKYHNHIRPYTTLCIHRLASCSKENYAMCKYKITYLGKAIINKIQLSHARRALILTMALCIFLIIPYILACVVNKSHTIVSDFSLIIIMALNLRTWLSLVRRTNRYDKAKHHINIWLLYIFPLLPIAFAFFSLLTILTSL